MMKYFRLALVIAAALVATPVLAQTETPTPQTVIGDRESAILRGFFERLAEAQQSEDTDISVGDIVRDVIIATSRDGKEADDNDDEDDDGAGKKDKGKKNKGKKDKSKGKGRGKGLPPGLAKQLAETGQLPPGLQRKLEESGTLPPGLSAAALPADLDYVLPDLPKGQRRVIVDDDVLIIEVVTGAVIDALPDVIPPEVVPVIQALPQILGTGQQTD